MTFLTFVQSWCHRADVGEVIEPGIVQLSIKFILVKFENGAGIIMV